MFETKEAAVTNRDPNHSLFFLIDKYLKSNNNYLPLQAYLYFLDSESLAGFESISNIKSNKRSVRKIETASSLSLIRHATVTASTTSTSSQNEATLAQKSYKCVITIDFSCHLSSIELIRNSLDHIFDKIKREYEQFSNACLRAEPVVDLTVLLWNPLFKHELLGQDSMPFVMLVYSKRLVKSSLDTIAVEIIAQLNKSKNLISDSTIRIDHDVCSTNANSNVNTAPTAVAGQNPNANSINGASYKLKTLNSFELLVSLVIKVFSYLSVVTHSSNHSVNSSLNFPSQHHIHITDGIFYTSDMIKTLDRIGKSAISFSFVCTGSNSQTGVNISSSFGYLADHFLMKFIASISNGFYGVIDENLEFKIIYSEPIFYFHDMSTMSSSQENQESLKSAEPVVRISGRHGKNKQKLKSNTSLVQRYEVPNRQPSSLFQIIRLRVQDGFYLVNVGKRQNSSPSKRHLIELQMKKYFTPTVFFSYKLAYHAHGGVPVSKFSVEIWIGYQFLNFKSKYQNVYLSEQIKQFLLQIQKLDFDRTFELTNVMTNPPEILKYKEPLFKILLSARDEQDLTGNDIFSMQNLNFVLNLRQNMESEFINFANAWFNLSFFRYNKHVLNKFYTSHIIKLILDYDKPVPSITSFLFDIKNSTSSSSSSSASSYYHHHHSHSYQHQHSTTTASMFKCQGSLNKLYTLFADWCDIVLVENCVYLKLIELSTGVNTTTSITPCRETKSNEQLSDTSDNEQQDNPDYLNTSRHQNQSSSSKSPLNVVKNSSCMLIRLDTQYAPYVSVHFVFHVSIPYLDCVCLVNAFEERIGQLNLQSFASNLIVSSSLTVPPKNEKSSMITVPISDININIDNDNNSTTTPATTPTGGTTSHSITMASVVTAAVVNNNNNTSLAMTMGSNEVNECCHVLRKTDIFETMKSWLFDESNFVRSFDTTANNSGGLKETVISQIPNTLKTNYLAMNILKCKKYEWTVNKKFAAQVGERVKEAIIDTFVRTRLKEGFKCIFQSAKFVVFIMQIYMYDTCKGKRVAEVGKSKEKKKTDANSKTNASPQTCTFFYVVYFQSESSPSSLSSSIGQTGQMTTATDKNAASRNLFNSKSKLTTSRLNNGDYLLKQPSKDDDQANGGGEKKMTTTENCFFRTEIYYENIEGINKQSSIFKTAPRETNKIGDYFKKLTNTEIVNLIHLVDMKAFLSLQSVYSLFLSKPDFITNVSAFRNYSKVDLENLCANSALVKVQDYDVEFFDSIRLLPDLNILFRRNSFSKLNRFEFSKSTQGANLHNRIDFKTRKSEPECRDLNEHYSDAKKLSIISIASEDIRGLQKTHVKHKSKKLSDQLKPVLNCVESVFYASSTSTSQLTSSASSSNLKINFDFSLRGILFESVLYLCVFEDIPFNLFKSSKTQTENLFMRQMQTLFCKSVDEEFKKMDDLKTQLREHEKNEPASSSSSRESLKSTLYDNIRKEIKNAIIFKLNDLKIGDLVTKQIIDHLKSQIDQETLESRENFKFYVNFTVSQVATAKSTPFTAGGNSSSSPNQTKFPSFMPKSTMSYSQYFPQQQHQQQNSDVENNNLFIFGLFFLSGEVKSTPSSHNSNKLVLFFFNCTPEKIKSSLVNFQKNICLIRKPLFAASKKLSKSQDTNKAEYRFYYSNRSGRDANSAMSLKSTDLAYKNLIKNTLSISEILKYHLELAANDTLLLNCFDYIEETAAKLYIKSLIHYLGEYSVNKTLTDDAKDEVTCSVKSPFINLDQPSIDQLLKLGKKIKLIDIDLTDYFRVGCGHLSALHVLNSGDETTVVEDAAAIDWKQRCTQCNFETTKHAYLQNKFNEIFLAKIDSLPGLNDLFMFSCKMIESSAGDDIINVSQLESSSSHAANKKTYGHYESSIDPETNQLTPLLTQTEDNHENLQDNEANQKKTENSDDSDIDSDEVDSVELKPINYYENGFGNDSKPFSVQLTPKTKSVASSLTIASTTPSITFNKNTASSIITTDVNSNNPSTDSLMQHEQIIGIEYVCVIDWTTANKTNENVEPSGSETSGMRLLTSTTLTSDSGLNDANELTLAPTTSSNSADTTTVSAAVGSNNNKSGTLKYRKQVQYCSRIDKFRFSCLLDMLAGEDSLRDFVSQVGSSAPNTYVVKIFLRFNWYSFYELDTSNYFSLIAANPLMSMMVHKQQQQLQQQQQQQQQQQIQSMDQASKQTFYYNHMLLPKIDEFTWHLRDEAHQFGDSSGRFGSLAELTLYRSHIRLGVLNSYTALNVKEVTRLVLSKHKIITTTSVFDAVPKTNASKLPPALKPISNVRVEEDRTILNVDATKFLAVFKELFAARLTTARFYNCKLEQVDDKNYYLICCYRPGEAGVSTCEFNFRILIKIKVNKIKKKLGGKGKANGSSISPTIEPTIGALNDNNSNNLLSSAKSSAFAILRKQPSIPNATPTVGDQYPLKSKTLQVTEELAINKLLIKSYFAFNHLRYEFDEPTVQRIATDFKAELGSVISLAYLALVLKEIHDTRKWNNMLKLAMVEGLATNPTELNSIERPRFSSLTCPHVWHICFKLHRLHQTQQKIQQQPHVPQQSISLGLKKLRESLLNFKIDETTCDDIYVFTRSSEIYLLTLEEVFTGIESTTKGSITGAASSNVFGEDSSDEMQQAAALRNARGSIMSRRSSNINANDVGLILDARGLAAVTSAIKSQNLSGGGDNVNNAPIFSGSGVQQQQHASSVAPEYICLKVFGLQDPDDEMKRFLCKTLQSELDYWLLIKMCNSIEKNTYKTTSAQHPDKITDEDLQFFKNICESYCEYEIPLPFVFNFNKALRENFFYFVKQIFNANFKSIDPLPTYLNSTFMSENGGGAGAGNRGETSGHKHVPNDEYEELNNLINKEEFFKHSRVFSSGGTTINPTFSCDSSTKRNSAQVYTTASTLNLKRTDSDTNNNILLTRIFFHNSKNIRIGKHGVSLVLVEALYSLKGLKYNLSSKLTRSNSIGSNAKQQQQQIPQPQQPSSGVAYASSQLPESQALDSTYSQARKSGPAFVFKFYCRGENDINTYKLNLKSALNDALSCFLSEYLTRIDPEMYLKKIKLKKNPAIFRLSESAAASSDMDERLNKSRKRHKSTGNEWSNMADSGDFNYFSLKMNKPANQTKLGRMLLNEKITNESQLNSFIVSNFGTNLFDLRDYEDTIEYFREPIKLFDCNRIINNIVTQYSNHHYNETTTRQHDDSLSSSDLCNGNDPASNFDDASSTINHGADVSKIDDVVGKKCYLIFIYDWLKWFHYLQTTNSNSYRLSSSLFQSPNPTAIISTSGSSTTSSATQSFIFRKKLTYHTKYNLISLLREVEMGMKEICKCDINTSYFAFKNTSTTTATGSSCNNNLKDNYEQQAAHDMSSDSIFIENDDFDGDKEFANLRQTSFNSLNDNLSRMENMIITMNAEYYTNLAASMSSSINSAATCNRVPSFSGQEQSSMMNKAAAGIIPPTPTTILTASNTSSTSSSNNSHSTLTQINNNINNNNIMSKSVSSMSGGDLESSLSLSLSISSLQLKRTYCFLIVNSKLKTLTFYAFTTESTNYDAIKQVLDSNSDVIKQRYHLVNNTILYKYGGLVGDNLIYDFKKVKLLTQSACQLSTNNHTLANELSLNLTPTAANDSQPLDNTKKKLTFMSKSPTFMRQFSHGTAQRNTACINPALIANLQFTSNPSMNLNSSLNLTSTQTTSVIGNSTTSSSTSTSTSLVSSVSVKQMLISPFNNKQHDSIIGLANQQVAFSVSYLTGQMSMSAAATDLTMQSQSRVLNAAGYLMPSMSSRNGNSQFLASTLYGVGMYYQLFEMQQVYRHPRKIYEIALNLNSTPTPQSATQTNRVDASKTAAYSLKQPQLQGMNVAQAATSIPSTTPVNTGTTNQPKPQQSVNINDFYNNYVQPVLIPIHYCCTPLLFYPNWSDQMVTEDQLNTGKSGEMPIAVSSHLEDKSVSTSSNPSVVAATTAAATNSNLMWYSKMRQIILIEYSSFFETLGFIRIKEDKNNDMIIKQQGKTTNQQQQQHLINDAHTYHFIKWIQQDGFLYITMSLEQIYISVKLGYCYRYRSPCKIAFLDEIAQFLLRQFHVHSYIYDYHLTAINTNFISYVSLASIMGLNYTNYTPTPVVTQTAEIIANFLNQFVEFFARIPIFSSNTVIKTVYERWDNALIPHKFGLIFGYIIDVKKKLAAMDVNFNLKFKTLYLFDNNIGIYLLNESQPPRLSSSGERAQNFEYFNKYLVIKIENCTKEVSGSSGSISASQPAGPHAVSSPRAQSSTYKQQLKKAFDNSSLMSKEYKIRSNSSSTASLQQLVFNKTPGSSTITPIASASTINNMTSSQTSSNGGGRTESFIKISSYYLYINKTSSDSGGTSSGIKDRDNINQDLVYINKIVDESLSLYKQDIFWENLRSSVQALYNLVNDSGKQQHSPTNQLNNLAPLMINTDELEQVLAASTKINMAEVDKSLCYFLRQCYSIRENIKQFLKQSLGRYLIYADSDVAEYCLLLINDDLIKSFKVNTSKVGGGIGGNGILIANIGVGGSATSSSSSISAVEVFSSSSSSNTGGAQQQEIKSFILIKFDKTTKNTTLVQVNRVKVASGDEFREESSGSGELDSQQYSGKSTINRPHLNFTMNLLSFAFWESIFNAKEK